MPIYEYYCSKCKKEFELRRPISEADAPAFCPRCGSEGQKLISGFASKLEFYIRPTLKVYRKLPEEEGEERKEEK